jgi:iron-regulated transporter 1
MLTTPTSDMTTLPSSTAEPPTNKNLVRRLYVSHMLSTWNARTFEFGAVIFLAAVFPGTLFFASCYALCRAAAAAVLGSWVGGLVDRNERLEVVRASIVWQRLSVAASCLVLAAMMGREKGVVMYVLFGASVVLACVEKLAFVANTVAVERDWIVVVAESLKMERQELNSTMRRIDLVCKLVAPVGIGLLDGYSTRLALWVVFVQNAVSVGAEYFAIAHVYTAVPELGHGKGQQQQDQDSSQQSATPTSSKLPRALHPWISYLQNPAFLASFALSLLYLTVLSFASQMTTYLLTLGFTSTHVSLMRLGSAALELSATVAAPFLTRRALGPMVHQRTTAQHRARARLVPHVHRTAQARRSHTRIRRCALTPRALGLRPLRAIPRARRCTPVIPGLLLRDRNGTTKSLRGAVLRDDHGVLPPGGLSDTGVYQRGRGGGQRGLFCGICA